MGRIATTRLIQAPVEVVFDAVAHIESFRKAVPDIVNVEFISSVRKGIGTRFKETRRVGKREATVELEVREYVVNERVRIVSDAGGTIWDTVFTVGQKHGSTELSMVMEDKAYKLLARLFNPLIRGMIRKAIERDMDAVKTFCESPR